MTLSINYKYDNVIIILYHRHNQHKKYVPIHFLHLHYNNITYNRKM